jgi:NADH-quinone oxidoreductase subunit G
MLNCTINGKAVQVKPGTSIIEAFMTAKENIAHYCWHPGLSIAGVCRMCMVEIEGNPRLQIACNTTVTEGMKVNNTSVKVKESVEWTLGFHLINHPLDCPICDQAGECGLQEYYMQYGKYEPGMAEHKVSKDKVVDLGSKIVLDKERCILCSRCTRFTEEVSKTNEFGIFNRGDHSEIGTVDGMPVENNYALNTVDICPVGALTSKDFRFRQRVWYLKDFDTVCNGCSTGCNVKVYFNENGLYRVKPVHNPDVNGYWMCDVGRDIYKFVDRDVRQIKGTRNSGEVSEDFAGKIALEVSKHLKAQKADSTAVVLTGQYTVEEYKDFISYFKDQGVSQFYHWINNPDELKDFDGILYRGDNNPNTHGLVKAFHEMGVKDRPWNEIFENIEAGKIKTVVVTGPEIQKFYPDLESVFMRLNKADTLVWLTSCKNDLFEKANYVIPMKSFAEKNGTFVNHAGKEQKIKKGVTVVSEALTLSDAAQLFSGKMTVGFDQDISKGSRVGATL